jgi:DNA polymerase I-like protein with 3'-5' exonuclease and polymerase domains
MHILTIDFETYYDKQFSLSKLTTEEYIRDPQFEVIGVAVKKNDEPTEWFSGTHKQIKKWLDGFDWDNSVAVAHNAMFDMAILSWLFDIRPKKIADTLSMARAVHTIEVGGSLAALVEYYELGEKGKEVLNALGKKRLDFTPQDLESYAGYCVNDVELTYKLFGVLAKGFPIFELNLIDLTIRMFSEPVLVLDVPLLEGHLQRVRDTKEKLLSKAMVDRKNLMSNNKFAELLMQCNVTPPKKISPTTNKETYAFAKTDEGFKALLEHENPVVQILTEARLGTKSTLEETRTERFLGIASRGTLPIPLRYYAAHTGRWGGDDKVNMQNLPRKSALKKAICAPEGYIFIDCDLSQIEARMLAWLAGQEDLLSAFEQGQDVYKIMASAIYGKPVDEIDSSERFVGKTTILGCGYGMGAAKFQTQLETFGVSLEQEECQRIINVYRSTYEMIPRLWYSAGDALEAIQGNQSTFLDDSNKIQVLGRDGVLLPNGLRLRYPNLRREMNEDGREETVYDTRKGRAVMQTRIYGGKVIENVCQALARIVIGQHLLKVSKRYKVVMTVHDAIGCIAPVEEKDEAFRYIDECMRERPEWAMTLPLDCEGGYGPAYGKVETVDISR